MVSIVSRVTFFTEFVSNAGDSRVCLNLRTPLIDS